VAADDDNARHDSRRYLAARHPRGEPSNELVNNRGTTVMSRGVIQKEKSWLKP
jgi:hypothetical protein